MPPSHPMHRKLFRKGQDCQVKISVIVPAKNEALLIDRTLAALENQSDCLGNKLDPKCYEVLLLCNNCSDESYKIARAYQKAHPEFLLHVAEIQVPEPFAHIGTVRRMLMDEAYDRFLSAGNQDGIIVSTDGDSEVDNNWIYYIGHEMAKGNDVVGGRILSKSVATNARLYHLQDVSYRYLAAKLESVIDPCDYDPWPRHFQCYGPSLAVTCAIYEKAGRLPAIPFLEDDEFRKALYRIDARIRKSPDVKVYTSARQHGQVDFGFSVQLKTWAEMKANDQQQQVEGLPALTIRLENKKNLRHTWELINHNQKDAKLQVHHIAHALFLNEKWLWEQCLTAPYFGTLWEKIETRIKEEDNAWVKHYQLIPISDAIIHLRAQLNTHTISSPTDF